MRTEFAGDKPQQRRTASLDFVLEKRLTGYAAGAAAVGMMALAQPLQAEVIYTPERVDFFLRRSLDIDLNHDGIAALPV